MSTESGALSCADQQNGNKRIQDGHYDKALAVKCINGTFVGMETDGIISYKGIPFVGKQPVGDLRWKDPVDVAPDSGLYEAYHYGKAPVQAPIYFATPASSPT